MADAALVALTAQSVDLIVLDLGLPDGDGLAWLRRLRQRDRLTPTLILTARDRVADRVLGLHGGADDYLVKPSRRKNSMHALKCWCAGRMSRVATSSITGG